jgi:hypothetical protein
MRPPLYGRSVPPDELEERRRIGLEMQASLPKPRRRRKSSPMANDVGDVADMGCLAADFGPAATLLGLVGGVVWVVARRKRAAR